MKATILLLYLLPIASALSIWPQLTSEDGHLKRPKPQDWAEKNFGQWCRNFTAHLHTQCPEASLFHEFLCCGPTGTDCCFAIQGWLVVVGSISTLTTTSIIIFYLLLKWNLIFNEDTPPSSSL